MPGKTNTTHIKLGKSFAIDCTTRFDKKIADLQSKWIAAIHRNNWVSERWIYLQSWFCVNMLNLAVTIPIYCYIY